MKYFIGFLGVVIIILAIPRLSTQTEFSLTEMEYEQYHKKAIDGDSNAIDKLYLYYHYSLDDAHKALNILREGAKLNDAQSQYRLSLYFLRDYYPYGIKESFKGEGIYWLEKAANQGYKEAINELRKRTINKF